MADEEDDRQLKSMSVDNESVTYLSPAEQAAEDRRKAEKKGLKRTKSLATFFRIFGISTQDRP